MTVSFINRQTGSDTSNPLGLSGTPRQSWPTQADRMVIRLARGSRYDMTTQTPFTAQGMIITDYGDPALPKPILSCLQPSGSTSHPLYGDTIFANIHFDLYDRVGNETQASPLGQSCVSPQRRGNAASPARVVSSVFLGCSFTRIGNNAITCGFVADGEFADAAPVAMLLGCDFDGIAADAFFGSVSDYFEAAHCTAKNFGIRTPSTSDFVGLISCVPRFVWIHDNEADKTTDDARGIIMIDVATGQNAGLAVIERNILLGFGAQNQTSQAVNNVGVNVEMPNIFRQNYVRGSRLLYFTTYANAEASEIHSNVFDFHGGKAAGTAAVNIAPAGTSFFNNTLVARRRDVGAAGVYYLSGATQSNNSRNLYVGFNQPISTSGARANITGGNNRFAGTTGPSFYSTYSTGAVTANGTGDLLIPESELVNQFGIPMLPRKGALIDTMDRLDRRVPDFWGRFAPEGIGYIGALMERG